MTYLGFDLGTSGLRALLIDDGGHPVASAEAHYHTSHPHPGWSEQDAGAWTDAASTVMAQLQASHPKAVAAIQSIGVSGHMHGATLVGDDGEVLRPCILWNDTRSHAEAAKLDALPEMRAISGNIVFPGFTAPKLLWVKKHEPKIFERISKVLLPAAYMNFWLTGDAFADMSDSAGTSWLDTGARDWSDTLLSHGAMRVDQMPRLVEGCEIGGTLRPELAKVWGIKGNPSVVGGAGDNAAAASGIGAIGAGTGFVSLGTSGVLMVARDDYCPDPATAVHTFCHALPSRWYQMGVILAATDSLNWVSNVMDARPDQLSALLGDALSGPSDLRFLPYLSGERTPHNDSAIRGAFLNLDIAHTRADLVQAVMEGVAFALADCKFSLQQTGAEFDQIFAIGGGARSEIWVQMLATILDMPLHLPKDGEFGAAIGAARLAMIGATGADPETVLTKPETARVITPQKDLVEAYAQAHHAYRKTYAIMKELP
ncbi:MAG: xylulokinase [Pseudomonadota bacterium]